MEMVEVWPTQNLVGHFCSKSMKCLASIAAGELFLTQLGIGMEIGGELINSIASNKCNVYHQRFVRKHVHYHAIIKYNAIYRRNPYSCLKS